MTSDKAKRLPADPRAAAGDSREGLGLKVLVADDHHLVREGLKLSLREIDEGAVVLEAASLAEAIDICTAHPDIDLVLLDLTMPGSSGVSALDTFGARCPSARLVVVSAAYDMATVQAAIRKGALGFIPKAAGKRAFLGALKFVLDGGIYVPPETLVAAGPASAHAVMADGAGVASSAFVARASEKGLTNRQIEVLRELLEGKSNKQICRSLNLAMGTVKAHVTAVLSALGVSSRAEAIAAVDRLGWRQVFENPAAQQPDSSRVGSRPH
jgi:DNA-binding NarL/FixJ family response regulator